MPTVFALTPEQQTHVLELQRAQYRSLADRETYHAAMLQAEKDMRLAQSNLDQYNAEMTKYRDQLRTEYKCPDCELRGPDSIMEKAEDIQFVKVPVLSPNQLQ